MKRAPRVRACLVAALVATAMLTSACASPDDGDNGRKSERGRYTFGLVGGQPEDGEPVRGGTLRTAAKKYAPWLAESLDSSDDLKTWTLKLRDGVKFSDGTPLDAEAVVGSIAWYQKNKGADTTLLAPNLAKTRATDDSTVVFNLRKPWATFPAMLAQAPGMIVAPAAYAGKKFEPIGAGAFTLDSYAPQEEMSSSRTTSPW